MDAVGLLDERYFFFFEETDWATRMDRAGWKIYFVPSARIFHLQGQSVGHRVNSRILYYRSRYAYFKKWHKGRYNFMCLIVFIRLLVNAFLNLLVVVGTLGLNTRARGRLSVYAGLIGWHLNGRP